MQDNGFTVIKEDAQKMTEIRSEYQIPAELQSCHVAIVDGYVIEGHVPSTEIKRLLAEQPNFTGLAVPGMPPGSPGMETESGEEQPYDVIAFGDNGFKEIYASYSK
jgi:hypothetical protein